MATQARFRRSNYRKRGRVLAILVAMAMLLTLPLSPQSQAQGEAQGDGSLPSSGEQQQAAQDLLNQLDNIDGPVDPADLVLDPALGPPPWTSFVPGRDESTIDAWNALAARLGAEEPLTAPPGIAQFSLPNAVFSVQDSEASSQTGLNDTVATGQLISALGTGAGEENTARIFGTFGIPLPPPPPPPEPDCPSVEEDGAIPLANATPLAPPDISFVLCAGVIGDGEFGSTSGDVDFFAIGAVEAGGLITVDAGSFDPNAVFAVTTAVYTSDGTLIAALNDSDSTGDSVLSVIAPIDDVYFAAVAGIDALPSDPFDPSSGTGVTYTGDYLVIVGNTPAPPPPCLAVEPDSTIPEANQAISGPCFGLIGDGDFGASTGDFDFFAVDAEAGDTVIVDVVLPPSGVASPTTIGLYNAAGDLIASADDDGTDGSVLIALPVSDAGTYYALVSSPGVLPADPFDASSGTVAGPETNYVVFVLALEGVIPLPPPGPEPTATPPPPGPEPTPTSPVPEPTPTPTPTDLPLPPPLPFDSASIAEARAFVDAALDTHAATMAPHITTFEEIEQPCMSVEDDGAPQLANPADVELGSSLGCIGVIGDGPFGATTGDFDLYRFEATRDDVIIAEVQAAELGELDSFIALVNVAGVALAVNDDPDGANSALSVQIPADGTYFAAVLAAGTGPQNPFDSGSGTGAASTGPYGLTISRLPAPPSDTDVYLVDLEVGDVLGAGFQTRSPFDGSESVGRVTILNPQGEIGMQSGGTNAIIYPLTSPLRQTGNLAADYVARTAGVHAVVLSNGFGIYEGELRLKRAGQIDRLGDEAQIVFLDFDGGQFTQGTFDPFSPVDSGPVQSLSPLAAWLSRWGLSPGDENAVIDAIIAEFTENIYTDLHNHGGNGHRDATGNGGEFDIEIRNSRDDGDLWGQPNVSRIIIGGSIDEAGIPTVGIAQSIDPGNFNTEETAIVLLDLLSAPAGTPTPTLNNFGLAAPRTMIDLVGRGVGIIAAHEAGHFIGNWHTNRFNDVASVMDEGGDIVGTLGIGPDLIFGSVDDTDTDFVLDEFSLREGFFGDENTLIRSAQGLSTGPANVPVVSEVPDEGVYNVRNASNGRVLDADADDSVNTSTVASTDDRWELINVRDDIFSLRNLDYDSSLVTDPDGTIEHSSIPQAGDLWQIIPSVGGTFYLRNVANGTYLSAIGNNVRLTTEQLSAERWIFDVVAPDPVPFLGERIALQNASTSRWLDVDGRNVGQSFSQGADDVWLVSDAGDGYVYLINQVTDRYLDADGIGRVVDTSLRPASDDRWEITVDGDVTTIRNVDTNGFLFARPRSGNYRVVTVADQSVSTQWSVRVIDSPA